MAGFPTEPVETAVACAVSSLIAVALALVCSAAWAIANVYVQRAGRAVGSLRAMLWAQGVASVALVILAACVEGRPSMPALDDLVITAVGSAIGYYAMLVAFSSGALSAVVPIVTAWSVPAAVAGVVWSGDRPSAVQWVGGAMILVGAVGNGVLAVTTHVGLEDGGEPGAAGEPSQETPRSAVLWACAGAVGFGVMAAGTARMRQQLGAVGVVPAIWIAQWALLAPLLLFRSDLRVPPPRAAWPAVLGMGLFEAIGFVSFTVASRYAPVAVVSPPASLSSLLTVLYGWLMLGEKLGAVRWALVLLAGVGTLVVAGS